MKGENLTSVITDKMPGHVAECVDIFEDFKENSVPVNKVNGHDISIRNKESDASEQVKIIETSDQNNQLESLNRTEKKIVDYVDVVLPNSSKQEMNSSHTLTSEEINFCSTKICDSSTSILDTSEAQIISNKNNIHEKSDIKQLNNCHLSKPVNLDITSLKLEKVRMVLDSVLKTPLRDMLKSKIETSTKSITKNTTATKDLIISNNRENEQQWEKCKITPKRVRFLAENCFKFCDKNEIKTLLSPLMKTSLSEILRSNVNSQTFNDQNILNSDESTIDLSCSDYQKILSDGESCHSINCSEIQSAIDNKRIHLSEIEIKEVNETSEGTDEYQRFFCNFSNRSKLDNKMNHKSNQERLRNAMNPLLKMSISDVIRKKLNKSGTISSNDNSEEIDEELQKLPNCSKILLKSGSNCTKIFNHGRITRSRFHILTESSRKSKTTDDDSFNLIKSKNKTTQNSLAKRISGKNPNLLSQLPESFLVPDQIKNIQRKRRRKRYFKGGKYNLTARRRRKKSAKISNDDEEINSTHSEERTFLMKKWPSDISMYDTFSSFSSEYSFINCDEEINKKFKNNQVVFSQMKNMKSMKTNMKDSTQMNSDIRNFQELIQKTNSKQVELDEKLCNKFSIITRNKIHNRNSIHNKYIIKRSEFINKYAESQTLQERINCNSIETKDPACISFSLNKIREKPDVNNEETNNYVDLSVDQSDDYESENNKIKYCNKFHKKLNDSNTVLENKHFSCFEKINKKQEEIEHAYTKHISCEESLKINDITENLRGTSNNDSEINKNSHVLNSSIETNIFRISESSNNSNSDKKDGKLTPEKAGERLRELITEKQATGDDGVFVTITVNADGIVEDIEKIEPSAFLDIGSMSTFVPIEESSEEIVINSSPMPVLECVPLNNSLTNDTGVEIQSSEVADIPEPCYTLEIKDDEFSTMPTEQETEEHSELVENKITEVSNKHSRTNSPMIQHLPDNKQSSVLQNIVEKNNKDLLKSKEIKLTSATMNNNEINNDMVCNVKYRHRLKRKLPEDHVDVDCISIASSSSTETETKLSHKKIKTSGSLTTIKSPSPPKLKLETCSVFDHTQKGGSCHKTSHTNLVGLRLIKNLSINDQNLLKERTGINIKHPGLTICQHHKKIFLDKYENIFKTDNNFPPSICTCYNKPVESEKKGILADPQKAIYCQAKDSIDEKVIGCSNIISNRLLVRPSMKIPYMMLCEVHMWRLHHHQCCPCCGIFCTQGTFSQCVLQRKTRCQIHLFHCHCISSANGLGEKCPHCGATSNFRKIKLELNVNRSPSKLKEKSFIKSAIKNVPLLEEPQNANNNVKNSASSTELNNVTSEKLALNKLQQQALLSLMSGEKMNMRFTIKSFYGPIKTGDIDKFLQMLAIGFNPNHRFEDHENETPLHIAATLGHLAFAQVLVQAGASVDHMNNELYTPLMLAVENNHMSVVLYLLAAGAQLDARSEDGMTCLHLAAQSGHGEICNVLLNTGRIDVNVQDDGGWTPLVWAAENQHVNVVKLLLEWNADPNVRDNEENVALHWSAYSGNVDISQLFLDVGCELGAANIRGDTPLHISARQSNYECVVLFLARGADPRVRNCQNETPIMCCVDQQSQTWMALSMNSSAKCPKKIETIFHRDLSRGRDVTPIQCLNEIDNTAPPDNFVYIVDNCETDNVNIDRTITSLQSCRCNNNCRYPSCTCAALSFKCWYNKKGHLLPEFNMADPPMIFECNSACLCWKDCSNRVVQYGIRCHLQVFRTRNLGWGIRTLQDIPKGTFVCEYIGEYVSETEAEKRDDDSFMFELDSRDDSGYCIDAKYFGNVGRFINHLCEANLCPVKVFIEHQDLNFPRIAFFTTRSIKSHEQLGFDYGPRYWSIKHKRGQYCLCNSEKCRYNKDTIEATLNELFHNSEEEGQS